MNSGLVITIKERCRMCYTCVRECPAKAIRVADGQAEILGNRCIACGNCVRVCSQHAKAVREDTSGCEALLAGPDKVAVCLAPAFAAEFEKTQYPVLVGMLKQLGFNIITEVAFGADLVAREYRQLLESNTNRRYIATTCPAVVNYIERYYPSLIPSLAPIVSPMVATARALRQEYGKDLKIVFAGPCIAKKGEAETFGLDEDIDVALTFEELRSLFIKHGVNVNSAMPQEFDPPYATKGVLFPVSRGLLETAEINDDMLNNDVVTATGRFAFTEAVKEFATGHLESRLLEVLCCDGCIMGPGMTVDTPMFRRRSRITEYARLRMAVTSADDRKTNLSDFNSVNMNRSYTEYDARIPQPSAEEIREALLKMGKTQPEDELNCGACGYATCLEHAVAICEGLAESEMCLPFTIDQLRNTCEKLETSNSELAVTREALIHSEKLASMGQLAAGIAHEVNNPLGTVLMLSNLLLEEHDADGPAHEDLELIASEANRCKKIVSGLLQFARQNKVDAQITDLRKLVEHVCRTTKAPDTITIETEHDSAAPMAEIDSDQIIQVLTNLMNNSINAMPAGGTLTVSTEMLEDDIRIRVADTGTGIREDLLRKIFEPFFTTKKAGKGTGLGLAVTYGIVKIHHGDIKVESNADADAGPTGTTFTITLPKSRRIG